MRLTCCAARWIRNDRARHARALTFRIDAQPVDVWADGDRILQVLGNLIRNAIKFSEKGGEIRLAARAISDKEVTFEVQDHGQGIPPEKLDLIFDRFQQADASDSRLRGRYRHGICFVPRDRESAWRSHLGQEQSGPR